LSASAAGGHRDRITVATSDHVVSAWVADLRRDGHVEVITAMQSDGTGSYGSLLMFVWTSAGLRRHPVAALSQSQARGYMGHDRFSLDNGNIHRTFPIYAPTDPNCCPTGGVRRLVYDFGRSRWQMLSDARERQVSAEDVDLPREEHAPWPGQGPRAPIAALLSALRRLCERLRPSPDLARFDYLTRRG